MGTLSWIANQQGDATKAYTLTKNGLTILNNESILNICLRGISLLIRDPAQRSHRLRPDNVINLRAGKRRFQPYLTGIVACRHGG